MGYLILVISLIIVLLIGFIFIQTNFDLTAIGIMVIFLLLLSAFMTLTIMIDDQYLHVKFGYGIFKKRLLLENIVSAQAVKNHWYYGWGIRFWFWPRMTIFNVSGFDAVELKMKDGKNFRIGTDDVQTLQDTIDLIIKK